MTDPPPGPRAKVDRANKHLWDLYHARNAFLKQKPKPIDVLTERQPNGEYLRRLKVLEPIPIELPLILGDGIHNLRSALDILVCELVRDNKRQVTKQNGFPIRDTAKDFNDALAATTEGITEPAREAIKRLKPYKRGNRTLWVLHSLDIADKHKVLFTVVAAGMGIRLHQQVFIPSKRVDCYEDGDVISRNIDNLDDYKHVEQGFDIALKQPGVVECEPIIPLLTELFELVRGVVHGFDPFFS